MVIREQIDPMLPMHTFLIRREVAQIIEMIRGHITDGPTEEIQWANLPLGDASKIPE
jgi:hypothetical protein